MPTIGIAISIACSTRMRSDPSDRRPFQHFALPIFVGTGRPDGGLPVSRPCRDLRLHALALARRLGLGELYPWPRRFRRHQALASIASGGPEVYWSATVGQFEWRFGGSDVSVLGTQITGEYLLARILALIGSRG